MNIKQNDLDILVDINGTNNVLVEGDPTIEKIRQLESGVQLKDYKTLPAKVRVIDEPELPLREKPVTPHRPTAWLEIKLREGKKRQIRHMTAAVGLFTLRIFRVAIGSLKVGDLRVGQWRELSQKEANVLLNER